MPCGPRAFAHVSGMGPCGTCIRVCHGSASRVRLSGYRRPRALHLGPTFQLPRPHPGVPAAAPGRPRGALGAASQQAPLELTWWLRLFLQAASHLFALPTQTPALWPLIRLCGWERPSHSYGQTCWSRCRPYQCGCSCTFLHPYSYPSSFFTSWAPCSHQPPVGGCQPATTAIACLRVSMECPWTS